MIIPGTLHLTGVHSPLPADLYFRRAPRTYTGQDLAEFHLISSPPLVDRLVADLLAAGARAARPGEFTLRAFLNGKKDLPQAEAVLAVIDAGTDADLTEALAQLAGGVSRPLDRLRDDLLNLLADVEAGLDFVGEDIEFVTHDDIAKRLNNGLHHLATLHRQLDERTVNGRPVRIALVGLPNAGKSSLFNVLAERDSALVSAEAGTTRDYLVHRTTWSGCDVELIDTAGQAEAWNPIEQQAQHLAQGQLQRADVLLHCVPLGEPLPASPSKSDTIIVRTKADLAPAFRHEPRAVSIATGEGVNELKSYLFDRVQSLARPPLASSQSRCRHHVEAATSALKRAFELNKRREPMELLALELRTALDQIGEMTGAIYTNDLLDRVFGRFCIGK
jgi:tRNA modification GTPase